ncbi:MAG: hypothetical protein ACOX2F_06275 [bacterium]
MRKLFFVLVVFFFSFPVFAAAAFAEAIDKDGNSITWTFSFEDGKNVTKAKNNAIAQLKKEGHANARSTVSTALNQGYFAVLYSAYWVDGVLRKSFAFGFSSKSEENAKEQALVNLKKMKGWKEEQGYSVNKSGSF